MRKAMSSTRSWIVSRCAETVKSLWYYDAEAEAVNAVLEDLMNKGKVDDSTQVSESEPEVVLYCFRKWR